MREAVNEEWEKPAAGLLRLVDQHVGDQNTRDQTESSTGAFCISGDDRDRRAVEAKNETAWPIHSICAAPARNRSSTIDVLFLQRSGTKRGAAGLRGGGSGRREGRALLS